MLILSQDKRKIINFNNVIDIIMNKYANTCPDITCCTLKDFEITLGEYATEERAQEVLQEIVKEYLYCNEQDCIASVGYVQNRIYEMPKE